MTKRDANWQRSVQAFATKAEFDALLGDLQGSRADQFGTDPEAVLWGETAWLSDATEKL